MIKGIYLRIYRKPHKISFKWHHLSVNGPADKVYLRSILCWVWYLIKWLGATPENQAQSKLAPLGFRSGHVKHTDWRQLVSLFCALAFCKVHTTLGVHVACGFKLWGYLVVKDCADITCLCLEWVSKHLSNEESLARFTWQPVNFKFSLWF